MGGFETLTFEEYAEAVGEVLGEVTYGKCKVSLHEVIKNNNKRMKAVTIIESDTNIAPTIYLEDFYSDYLQKGFTESVNSIIELYEKSKIKGFADFEFLKTYDKAKGQIMPRLINYEKNLHLLKEAPHIKHLDMAVVFHYLTIKDDGYASILITNTLNERWGKTAEELLQDAEFNLENSIYLNSIFDEIKALKEFEEALENDSRIHDLHILSNNARFYGAAALLSKKALKYFADSMGCRKTAILPSSIHEILLLPMREGFDSEDLKQMVRDINHSETINQEEFLSDNVYVYDRESETTTIA